MPSRWSQRIGTQRYRVALTNDRRSLDWRGMYILALDIFGHTIPFGWQWMLPEPTSSKETYPPISNDASGDAGEESWLDYQSVSLPYICLNGDFNAEPRILH